jgi:hypothetical protein
MRLDRTASPRWQMLGKQAIDLSKVATTPMLLISDESTSTFDNLDFEWSRQTELLLSAS